MIQKTVTISLEDGLHMRPAGILAREASHYTCEVWLIYKDIKINAKSVVGIVSQCIKGKETIQIVCHGQEEAAALEAISNLPLFFS